MTTRIGQIPYLNCEPFFHGLSLEGVELCPMPPSSMGPLALRGELDAAPFSLVQSFDLRGEFEVLGDMGISVIGPVKSILFFSRVPIDELSGAVVGATSQSATAVQLMKVLLEQRFGVRPREYASLEAPNPDAFLLIGDDALVTHNSMDGFPYVYDLADVWWEWKELPFVFAVWMARRDLAPEVKRSLAEALRRNLKHNMTHSLDVIASKRETMGLTSSDVIDYLQAFRFVFEGKDYRAIGEFERELRSLTLVKEAAV